MVRFDYNIIRYLTIFSASIALECFLICKNHADIHSSMFEIVVIDNVEWYGSVGLGNLVIIYTAMKQIARSHFKRWALGSVVGKTKIVSNSKQAISQKFNFEQMLSDESMYAAIGKVSMISIFVLINSFFLPIYHLFWLFAVGSFAGSILCCLIV